VQPNPSDEGRPAATGGELLRTYPALLAFFRRRLPAHRQAEAEDLAHETLVAAWSTLGRGGDGTVHDSVSYLLGIARNKFNQVLRDEYRSRDVALDGIPGDEHGFAVRHATEHELLEAEWREELRRALGKLRSRERDMLHLRFFEGLGNEEASRRLGMPPEAGSRLKYRALERLRHFLRAQ
jgi:RNA polymerase sigma-70 factor (ECF subfamily)